MSAAPAIWMIVAMMSQATKTAMMVLRERFSGPFGFEFVAAAAAAAAESDNEEGFAPWTWTCPFEEGGVGDAVAAVAAAAAASFSPLAGASSAACPSAPASMATWPVPEAEGGANTRIKEVKMV